MSDDNPDKKDMTRIEDLSEFLHNDDPEVDRLLSEEEEESFSEEDTEVSEMNAFPYSTADDSESPSAELDDLDDLPDLPPSEDDAQEAEEDEEAQEDPFSFGEMDSNPFGDDEADPFESTDDEQSEDEDEASAEQEESFFGEDDQPSFESLPDDEEEEEEVEEQQEASDQFDFASEAESEPDPTFEPDPEPEPEPEPEPVESLKAPSYPVRENFEDLKKFANSLSYGDVSSPGNPPFSLVIKDIKYQEDAEDILRILREHSLVNDDNEKDFSTGLAQGAMLIGQLSEYSAIYIAHKLRRFDLDISIGLSDEIHPAKSYEREGRGLTTKDQLYQNKKLAQNLDHSPVHPNDIIVATTPTLSGYKIERYIDVITEHIIISDAELREASSDRQVPGEVDEEVSAQEELGRDYHIGLSQIYYSLMQDLKPRAHKLGGNAILGINFSLVSLPGGESYKITCAGNVAWVNNE